MKQKAMIAGVFHNVAMYQASNNNQGHKKALFVSLGFAALSFMLHIIFIGSVGSDLEISSSTNPIRDTPVSVSLLTSKPIAVPSSSSAVAKSAQTVPKKSQNVVNAANAMKAKSQQPVDVLSPSVAATTEPSSPTEPTADQKADALPKEEVKAEIAKESSADLNNGRGEAAEKSLYPNGLGAIPVAGAFPYTFFYGDYSLNNALGSGSFIVESGDGKYKLVLIGKASGLTSLIFSGATYRSEGIFGNDGFAPQLYAEKSGNRAERVATADYSTKEVSFGDHKKPTLQGMQDRVSVIWQVGLVLRVKPEFIEKGMTLPIPLMSTRGLDNAQFVSQGLVDVDKRGVAVKAAHFKLRPSNPQNKAQIDLWYDLNNLPQPLRVRWIDERDRTLDIFRDD
jgi:Protein of unknown function (DUF3108)